MTCNLRIVNSVLRTVKNLYGPYELNSSLPGTLGQRVYRAKERNILSVENDMQFTDSKLCLTDRQKPLRTVRSVTFFLILHEIEKLKGS